MRTTIRVILCVCLMAVAVTMAAFTLAGFRKDDAQNGALMLGALLWFALRGRRKA